MTSRPDYLLIKFLHAVTMWIKLQFNQRALNHIKFWINDKKENVTDLDYLSRELNMKIQRLQDEDIKNQHVANLII